MRRGRITRSGDRCFIVGRRVSFAAIAGSAGATPAPTPAPAQPVATAELGALSNAARARLRTFEAHAAQPHAIATPRPSPR